MKESKRAERRKQEFRKKQKAKKILKNSWSYAPEMITDRRIGLTASTHGKKCSCHICGNPRKYWKEKTRQEILQDESEKFE